MHPKSRFNQIVILLLAVLLLPTIWGCSSEKTKKEIAVTKNQPASSLPLEIKPSRRDIASSKKEYKIDESSILIVKTKEDLVIAEYTKLVAHFSNRCELLYFIWTPKGQNPYYGFCVTTEENYFGLHCRAWLIVAGNTQIRTNFPLVMNGKCSGERILKYFFDGEPGDLDLNTWWRESGGKPYLVKDDFGIWEQVKEKYK